MFSFLPAGAYTLPWRSEGFHLKIYRCNFLLKNILFVVVCEREENSPGKWCQIIVISMQKQQRALARFLNNNTITTTIPSAHFQVYATHPLNGYFNLSRLPFYIFYLKSKKPMYCKRRCHPSHLPPSFWRLLQEVPARGLSSLLHTENWRMATAQPLGWIAGWLKEYVLCRGILSNLDDSS